jgi:hypothetical protein
MKFADATESFEAWLATFGKLNAEDLASKHDQMKADAFRFFRGTYYRWTQHWHKAGKPWADVPIVPSIGDLHLENYGTWRDIESRLCWGINDFDEADMLPYTQDLVRLASSLRFAIDAGLKTKMKPACDAILAGYTATLTQRGDALVLEENHSILRDMAMREPRFPAKFWDKLAKLLDGPEPEVPASARAALDASWPFPNLKPEIRHRLDVGMGSLGKPRFVALARYAGSWLAREVKMLTPPATAWRDDKPHPSQLSHILASANRSPDPVYSIQGGWVLRRVAPRTIKLDLKDLELAPELETVFHAMGTDLANVHLGRPEAADLILTDLASRPEDWLQDAAKLFVNLTQADWESQ